MGYFVGLGLQIPELKILFYLLYMPTTLAKTFILFSLFFLNSVPNIVADYMHKIENKSLWKEEMSYYGGDTLWVEHLKSFKNTLAFIGLYTFASLIRPSNDLF